MCLLMLSSHQEIEKNYGVKGVKSILMILLDNFTMYICDFFVILYVDILYVYYRSCNGL